MEFLHEEVDLRVAASLLGESQGSIFPEETTWNIFASVLACLAARFELWEAICEMKKKKSALYFFSYRSFDFV